MAGVVISSQNSSMALDPSPRSSALTHNSATPRQSSSSAYDNSPRPSSLTEDQNVNIAPNSAQTPQSSSAAGSVSLTPPFQPRASSSPYTSVTPHRGLSPLGRLPSQPEDVTFNSPDSAMPAIPLDGTSEDVSEQTTNPERNAVTVMAAETDVIGHIPTYAMPNISSMLPIYMNSEQEYIFRTFNVGNYDMLKHLPESFREQQVTALRNARMEATRRFLMPALGQPLIRSKPDNQQDLFSVFEFMPSRFSLADELASKQRVESEAKRMVIGNGKDFLPTLNVPLPKYKEYGGKPYPHLHGPHDNLEEAKQDMACMHRAGNISPDKPWVPSSGPDFRIGQKPTRKIAWDMMRDIGKWIEKDWEGSEVRVFENDQDCWVVQVTLPGGASSLQVTPAHASSGADPTETAANPQVNPGLVAYMNVFMRCNSVVLDYQLNKVLEFWATAPGDGSAYFVMRPPWVRPDRISSYYTLFPEEMNWRTTSGVLDVQRTQGYKVNLDELSERTCDLARVSRLDWGVNFVTGTAAPAKLGRMKESGP
ncbi:hypothetical protein CEUSTIGMA_g812.t1 [Chlamydomonas eustigma]|uniref:Uncharacterized protein n=1 Tax=Chlamydomonas eustigma TaxID=1157962 RepID=A0A250WRN4_9CHLO|nr:hypothetical protein CEUSTIGMA_g812.t1 [Chlamydomonas eustigma]|eukprot:GAX73359.1 hypothetical protein CEUSTIGMA_g812.t1 [Chlamydomonas eustigma]